MSLPSHASSTGSAPLPTENTPDMGFVDLHGGQPKPITYVQGGTDLFSPSVDPKLAPSTPITMNPIMIQPSTNPLAKEPRKLILTSLTPSTARKTADREAIQVSKVPVVSTVPETSKISEPSPAIPEVFEEPPQVAKKEVLPEKLTKTIPKEKPPKVRTPMVEEGASNEPTQDNETPAPDIQALLAKARKDSSMNLMGMYGELKMTPSEWQHGKNPDKTSFPVKPKRQDILQKVHDYVEEKVIMKVRKDFPGVDGNNLDTFSKRVITEQNNLNIKLSDVVDRIVKGEDEKRSLAYTHDYITQIS